MAPGLARRPGCWPAPTEALIIAGRLRAMTVVPLSSCSGQLALQGFRLLKRSIDVCQKQHEMRG
jgi:hypothetical protein